MGKDYTVLKIQKGTKAEFLTLVALAGEGSKLTHDEFLRQLLADYKRRRRVRLVVRDPRIEIPKI